MGVVMAQQSSCVCRDMTSQETYAIHKMGRKRGEVEMRDRISWQVTKVRTEHGLSLMENVPE